MTKLYEKIKHARKVAKLSQEQVGEACEPPISKAAVGMWESDDPIKRTNPKLDNLRTLAKLTDYPIEYFLDDEKPNEHRVQEDPAQYAHAKQQDIRTAITKMLSTHLKNQYASMDTVDQVAVITHLYELLHNDALRDSITSLNKITLLKLLQIEQ